MDDLLTVKIPYGREAVEFRLPRPNLLAVLEPAQVPGLQDPAGAMRDAVRHPIGTAPLSELVHDGQYILVIIDDMTRPTPTHILLPPLLEELESAGQDLRIEILIATGTHRPMTDEEIIAKVGTNVMKSYPVINHQAGDIDSLADLGYSANRTPIVVNKKVTEADLVIAIGNTVPHCLAGWAGGAKIVQPGVCGEATTNLTHALSMVSPLPHLGRLDNPMRQEIEDIVEKVRLDFVINTVLNEHIEVVHIAAGDALQVQRKTVELASQIWVRPVPVLPDIVVVSSYPADLDYWQGIKGLMAAESVIKRGGDIILVTPCYEGISTNTHHLEAMRAMKGVPSRQIRHEGERRGIEDLAGLNTATIAARINELAFVQVVSGCLSDDDLAALGHERAESVEAGLEKAFERQGNEARVLVITHGGDIAPVLRTELKS